jgi:hypothetical protein
MFFLEAGLLERPGLDSYSYTSWAPPAPTAGYTPCTFKIFILTPGRHTSETHHAHTTIVSTFQTHTLAHSRTEPGFHWYEDEQSLEHRGRIFSFFFHMKATSLQQLCPADQWIQWSANNTSPVRIVVLDDFHKQGFGHMLLGISKWLQLILQIAPHASVRFAFCIPPSAPIARQDPRFILAAKPCGAPKTYDPHNALSFRSLRNLRPDDADFGTENATVLYSPDQATLKSELRAIDRIAAMSGRYVNQHRLFLHYTHLKHVRRCLHPADMEAEACLRLPDGVRISPGGAVATNEAIRVPSSMATRIPTTSAEADAGADATTRLRCDVGVQLRTLALDDKRCNLLHRTQTEPKGCRRLAMRRSSRPSFRCGRPSQRFPHGLTGCPGTAHFATSDMPKLYNQTRLRGWHDLGERPVNPWIRATGSVGADATVAAWATLASCTHGIISPLPSAFATSAAMAAGVPLVGCCEHLTACLRSRLTRGCFNGLGGGARHLSAALFRQG